jgi:arabinose-5-phosphate isomerase
MTGKGFQQLGVAVLEIEAQAVLDLIPRIDERFTRACEILLESEGRVVVTGMGKSGHIARKIAATLASTGTPAFFVHPGEASHGDMGMITTGDVVIALSNSGETQELLTILPLIRRLGARLIAMTGKPGSRLAVEAEVNLDVSAAKEACPLGLAPTASTTAALAMGDALAVALLEARGFTKEDFAKSHPGGRLGRQLLVHVRDIMHTGEDIPSVPSGATLRDALVEMTEKRLGMTAVIDDQSRPRGVFTDGDLRRALDGGNLAQEASIDGLMTGDCVTVSGDILAAECLHIMETGRINGLLVVDDDGRLVGALNTHDLLRAGVF